MEYREHRKWAVRLQCVGGLILGAAGCLVLWRWQIRSLGDAGGLLVGFPLGCLAGIYAGSKALLKHKGLHPLGAFFAVLVMYAGMIVSGMVALAVFRVFGGFLMMPDPVAWMWLALTCVALAAGMTTWYAAKVFNFFADLDD